MERIVNKALKKDRALRYQSAAEMRADLNAFAGLWDRWRDSGTKQPLETSTTVITTDPNELVEPLHDRMPVILQPKDYDRWLTPGDPTHPVDLLRPFPAEQMKAWQVDRKVCNVKNDTPDCIEPMTPGTAGVRPYSSAGYRPQATGQAGQRAPFGG